MSGVRPEEPHGREDHSPYYNAASLGRWYSWDSPVGLGLFFISVATAIGIVIGVFRHAFH